VTLSHGSTEDEPRQPPAIPFRLRARDTRPIEPLLRARDDADSSIRVGWELLHLLQLSVRSLEDTATRVVAGQVAGLIALWTQLYTYEEALPKGFAWAAWLLLIASISVLGIMITPRRLARFWQHIDFGSELCAEPLDESEEAKIVGNLTEALRAQRNRLQYAIRVSVGLGIAALGSAALGYLVDKAFFGN
jgi:hypothetical protein